MEEEQVEKDGVCDVHYWAKNNSAVRKVYYCGFCDAWMCDECWSNLPLRAVALAKRTKFEMFG